MKKTAFVLSGGGSRGAYEIGVCACLTDHGIEPQIVTGTSVGALNGAMAVQGDYEAARRLWREIDNRSVMDVTIGSEAPRDLGEAMDVFAYFARQFLHHHGADNTPLRRLLASCIDEARVRQRGIEFGIVTVSLPDFTPAELFLSDIPEGRLLDYLLASAACYPAMRPQEIDGKSYIDGGYFDNKPVNMALSKGAERIYCVDLNAIGRNRKPVSDAAEIIAIETDWDLGSFIIFDKNLAEHNLALGYNDALKALGERDGFLYTFLSGELAEHEADTMSFLQHLHRELAPTPAVPMPGEYAPPAVAAYLKGFYRNFDRRRTSVFAAFAENAGKLFALDPLLHRTLAEYNRELLTALQREAPGGVTDPREGAYADAGRPANRRRLTAYLYELMGEARANTAARLRLLTLSAVFAPEYAAALYLRAAGSGLGKEIEHDFIR